MKENYAEALKRVLEHEGGYTNEATDPGGPTNYGITIYDARMYWKSNATAADVKAMPLEVAKQIYKSKYWDRMGCDNLASGVDYCTFDYGVNSGTKRAVSVLNSLKGSASQVINAMCDERMAFLQSLKIWPTYKNGWSTRVRDVRSFSLLLARGIAPIPAPPDIPKPEPVPVPQKQFWQLILEFIFSLFRRKS